MPKQALCGFYPQSHGHRFVIHDASQGRAMVTQSKTQRPVQFEITQTTRESVEAWIQRRHLRSDDFLFPSRVTGAAHLGTRQYARIVHGWVEDIGLDTVEYGTHSMRRLRLLTGRSNLQNDFCCESGRVGRAVGSAAGASPPARSVEPALDARAQRLATDAVPIVQCGQRTSVEERIWQAGKLEACRLYLVAQQRAGHRFSQSSDH